jgi:hypothetical protein
LQNALDQQNRIEWTIQTIQQLEEFGVDDSTKLDKIKELLEDEIPIPENDTKYQGRIQIVNANAETQKKNRLDCRHDQGIARNGDRESRKDNFN